MEDNNSASTQQYVTFSLGDELFGVEVSRTREILSLTPVTKVPQTPEYLLGVINLRGQVVPVVDMRLKLGLSAGADTEDTCIIVEIHADQIEPPPRLGTRLNTEFIKGMGKVDEQFLILLEIDRIFNSDEIAIVQEAGEVETSDRIEEETLINA